MNLRFITRDMSWFTRFKRLFIFAGILFLVVTTGALAFEGKKISDFEIVIMSQQLRGLTAVFAWYCSMPFIVSFLAAFVASATWLEDRFRDMISSSKTKQ